MFIPFKSVMQLQIKKLKVTNGSEPKLHSSRKYRSIIIVITTTALIALFYYNHYIYSDYLLCSVTDSADIIR